jgi:hypothetical protein
MAAITLQKSGLSDVTIANGRSFPVTYPIQFNQERYETEDQQPKVIDYGGSAVRYISVNADRITQTEFINIRDFFTNSAVNGAENSITLIDENGESHTVRLWSDQIEPTQTDFNIYSISLLFRRE